MDQVLESFTDQIKKGYQLGRSVPLTSEIEEIIIAGVGGSALPGAILKDLVVHSKKSIQVIRDYVLPESVKSTTLVVCISYSGETAETLSLFNHAWRKGCSLLVIGSGGSLLDLAESKNIPFVEVPGGMQPRMAYGYQFFVLLSVLEQNKLIPPQIHDVESTINALSKMDLLKDRADDFVKRLKNKTPVIYTSAQYASIGYKWKINFNETAKIHAFSHTFPEAAHNEIMAYLDEKKDYFAFFIQDESDLRMINKQLEFSRKLIHNQGVDTVEINLTGHSRLAKMFSALLLGDWIAYYCAKENLVDPSAISLVESLKKQMKTV